MKDIECTCYADVFIRMGSSNEYLTTHKPWCATVGPKTTLLENKNPMLIKIIPKSEEACNLVKEHGEAMILSRQEGDRILCLSLEETWNGPNGKEHWVGWFTKLEADWELIWPIISH